MIRLRGQWYLPETTFHIWVAPAILEASVSLSILRVGKSLEYISRELPFVRWTAQSTRSAAMQAGTYVAIHQHP